MTKNYKSQRKDKDMNIEQLMKQMLNLFDNTSKILQEEYEKLSQKDMELSDLDHYIEINTLRSYELAKIGRLRKNIKRRT